MSEEKQVHHQTKRGADLALAKKAISPASHAAILEGRLSLEEARELGREGSPEAEAGPAPKALDKDATNAACLCGCGRTPTGKRARWIPGHDQRAVSWAKAVARGEDIELSDEQRAYIETSGKLERARERVAEEDRKQAEREDAKAEKAAMKERREEREGKTVS